jgi:GntR family transcriptional repressor for pyruvate dehydrogenase complex
MTTPIIDKKNYSQQVFSYIFEQIDKGRLKPGNRLPNERQLSEEMGISRPPLREALKALVSLGLLTTRHGGGTYVNEFGEDYLKSMLRFMTVVDDGFVIDFVQMRKVLETESARMAATAASAEQIANLERIHDERKQLFNDNSGHLESCRDHLQKLDLEFHLSIAEASGNRVFSAFLDAMHNILRKHQKQAVMAENMTSRSLEFHQRILDAIKAKEPDEAAEAMYAHIASVEQAICANIARKDKT